MRYLAQINNRDTVVWIIPLSNIDGIEKGRYGKDYFPHDLNRSWGKKMFRHENLVIQRDIARWMERSKPVLALDFHAPGGAEGAGIYFPFRIKGKSTRLKKNEIEWMDLIGSTVGNEYMLSELKKDSKPEGDLKNLNRLNIQLNIFTIF